MVGSLRVPGAAALAAMLWLGQAAGQEISVRASLDANPVVVSQIFTLSLEVKGVRELDELPPAPPVEPVGRFLTSGTSSRVQVVNGQVDVALVVQYRYLATDVGQVTIPAVEVSAAGDTYRTEPITLTVADRRSAAPSGPAAPGLEPEDLFLEAEVSASRVYENQPIHVAYRLFTRVNVESYTLVSVPETEGFWAEDLPIRGSPVAETVTRGGVRYTTAVLRRAVLFPTGAGRRTVDPMTVEVGVRVRDRGGLLNDVFGSRLFGRQVAVPISSDPVDITVDPLPAGRPDGFTGLVGSLDVSSSVDRSQVDADDAVTLTVRVRGRGNLRGLAAPRIDFPQDFEVFDPEVTENLSRDEGGVSGVRVYEYVIIPRAPGLRTIPAIEMAYFDPDTRAYRTASSDPIALEVGGEASTSVAGVRSGVETLREDIRFIRLGSPLLRPRGGGLATSPGFWIVALLPLVALAGALGLRAHRDRLEGDVAWARGRRAGRVARKRLGRARELAGGDDTAAFFGEVSRALRGFLADKLNVSEAGFMSGDVHAALTERGVDAGVVREYLACVEHCDRQRYAPGPTGRAEWDPFVARAEAAMTALERGLRQ